MAIQQNMDPTEERLPDTFPLSGADDDFGLEAEMPEADEGAEFDPSALELTDAEVLGYLGDAKRTARNYQQISAMPQWEYAEAAYRSEHSNGSKYKRDQYKNRAKYFKPKTRNAVRKALTSTRAALLTNDIITCQPSDDGNPVQRANAALLQELINMRLSNKTSRSGVPWLRLAIGARMDCQKLGLCVSKQDWKYKVRERQKREIVTAPRIDEFGDPILDWTTGQPIMEEREEVVTVKDVICDRPDITLLPPEHVLLVPTAGWLDPIQESPVLIVQWPMHIDDVRAMMEDGNTKSTTPWLTIDDTKLQACQYQGNDLNSIKIAREGSDGAQQTKQSQSSAPRKGMALDLIDVWECFFHHDGQDYHCWTLRDQDLLSHPVPVDESYPAHRGGRPYVMGFDQIEPHVLYKDSAVWTWKQSQEEINDFTNLRMDATRQSIYPMAKVVAGRNIDYRAVQRRDAQGVVLVRDQNDVMFDRPPGPGAQAYQEANLLANDFDALAGNMDQSTVQTNRNLNETVGGMAMIAAAAGATSEFDLAIFIDTWVEQVISQLVSLEQYYEDDATTLAIAGSKAKLFQKYGVNEITDEVLESQVTVSVNVGVGGSDPMMKLMRLKTVMEMFMPYFAMAEKDGKAELNIEEIAAEIFGQGGYRNGSERFVKFIEQEGPKMVPADKVKELVGALEEMKGENEKLKSGMAAKMQIESAKLADKDKDRQFQLMKERMKQGGDMQSDMLGIRAEEAGQRSDQEHDVRMLMLERQMPAIPSLTYGGW